MKRKQFTLILVMAIISVLLAGCIPAGYSNNHKNEITKEHKDQAAAWFQIHRPDVKLNNDAQAYVSGSDLTAAIAGSYKAGGSTHNYIYDYINDRMYIDECYQAVRYQLLTTYLAQLGISEDQVSIIDWGSSITLISENDDVHPEKNTPKGEETGTGSLEYFPADMSPEEIYQATLAGEPYVTMHLSAYVNEYPEYNGDIFAQYANLKSVTYFVPITLPYDGIVSRRDDLNGSKETGAYIKELPNGLFAGYVWSGEKSFEDKVEYTQDEGGNFTISIPDPCKPMIISGKKISLTNYFTNSEGKEISNEVDLLYVEPCLMPAGCEKVASEFIAAEKGRYYYEHVRNSNANGTYHYKVK